MDFVVFGQLMEICANWQPPSAFRWRLSGMHRYRVYSQATQPSIRGHHLLYPGAEQRWGTCCKPLQGIAHLAFIEFLFLDQRKQQRFPTNRTQRVDVPPLRSSS